MADTPTPPGQAEAPAPSPAPAPGPGPSAPVRARRWPRRVAIGVLVTGALLGTAYWYLGRESTLQSLALRVASASGGKITITGVSGSLYGAMHIGHLVFRTPESVLTGDNIDIDWSPWQYLSNGVAISKLHVASLTSQSLKESEPAKMPISLAPPFTLTIDDARIARLTLIGLPVAPIAGAPAGAPAAAPPATVIDDVRFKLHGDAKGWQLRNASAATPWGLARAEGSIGAVRPFKLDGTASLTQSQAKPGATPPQLALRFGGDLATTALAANGQSGKAVGEANLTLAPFDPVPLREMHIKGRNIDPGFFNPALPTADLSITVAAKIEASRAVSGSVNVVNDGPAGTIDHQRLPLRAMRGQLTGNLTALTISDVLLDFGVAGKFSGGGQLQRSAADSGIGAAQFTLHTDRLDLKNLHSRLKTTSIAGDIKLTNAGDTQTLDALLTDAGIRLGAHATMADNLLRVSQADISAGKSHIRLSGNASLTGAQAFKLKASAEHFDPASFGDYPAADINADINADGHVAPAWKVAADFALRPSCLFNQPLSGQGKLNADASHVSGIDAVLALGKNRAELRGSFGAPGERLTWRVDGGQLSAVRADLAGSVLASGVVTGTMAAPRTSFEVDAKGLALVPAARGAKPVAAADSVLHASGEAWLANKVVEVKATGVAQRFNPAAFGSPLAGSINGAFDVAGRAGADWHGNLNLTLQPSSTLSNAPLFGYAKIAADAKHVSNADIDLHVGPNVLAAKGGFGAGSDVLDWRIDAPQLAALGPDFAGVLRGSGKLSGTMESPSMSAALEGQALKLLGKHQIRQLRASASLGTGHGAADPLVSDIEIAGFASGETRIDSARLQTSGTRGEHTIKLSAKGEAIDASAEVRGALAANTWNGTINALQNRGRYAFTLAAPASLRLAGAPGAGVMGLARPEQIALGAAQIRLPNGVINLQSFDKNGPRLTSKGAATGVPLTYLAQFSSAMRDNLRGDLTLGAQWALDMQAPAAAGAPPALAGMLRVSREAGDLIVGAEVPVALGLKVLDARADIADGALRMQLDVNGARAGVARVDATASMLQGRLGNDSPLKLVAKADMGSIAWLAPLAGQPGLDLDGLLKLDLTGAGTVGAPTLNGTVSGDKLAVRWTDQGVKLVNGQLRAQLAGDQLLLQRLSFDGNQGRAVADGSVRFSGGEATMQLKLVADKLEALSRPDRTLVISGQGTLVRDAKHFTVDGKFRADRALIELAPQDRPTISDDVIVLGRTAAGSVQKDAPSMPLTIDLEADLGDAFRLRGMGIDAELTGTVRLRAAGGRPPRANGTIRVASGTYAAYGQRLSIERGVLTFGGPYDNPSLNILAVRKRPEGEQLSETNVEAGVEVRGTALAPAAKLVSTPTVPDSEKLAWLVLGHGMEATSGNEAGVLSAAAGALLGGKGGSGGFQSKLTNALGLDELGLSQAKGLESTVVTVGKRISSRAYLSFEQGATTASSLVRLRYKLNPRITLQIQTGTNTAFDVLYSWAFD